MQVGVAPSCAIPLDVINHRVNGLESPLGASPTPMLYLGHRGHAPE